jgi:hypothetical protein
MIKSVIACALMMQLSMATKLEMARLFPEVASYCVAHPSGKGYVSYRFGASRRSSESGGAVEPLFKRPPPRPRQSRSKT